MDALPNLTTATSLHDYTTAIRHFSDQDLAQELQKNYWHGQHIQHTEINYKSRYLACLMVQTQREHAKHTTEF